MEGGAKVNATRMPDAEGHKIRLPRKREATFSWSLIHFSLGIPLALVYTEPTHGDSRFRNAAGTPEETRKL